jgi:hypothetical protein
MHFLSTCKLHNSSIYTLCHHPLRSFIYDNSIQLMASMHLSYYRALFRTPTSYMRVQRQKVVSNLPLVRPRTDEALSFSSPQLPLVGAPHSAIIRQQTNHRRSRASTEVSSHLCTCVGDWNPTQSSRIHLHSLAAEVVAASLLCGGGSGRCSARCHSPARSPALISTTSGSCAERDGESYLQIARMGAFGAPPGGRAHGGDGGAPMAPSICPTLAPIEAEGRAMEARGHGARRW